MWIGGSSVFFADAGLVCLDNAHGVSYSYDSSLRRKQKTANGVTTQYYYAGDELMAQTKGGTTIRFKRSAAGDYVGLKYNNTNYYYVKNLQGDVVGIVDANGTLKVSYLYDAWGRVLSVSGTLASTLGADNPIRYRSYYYDTETGWYFLGSRYYNPEWCRFISADVILGANQDIVSYNLYAYCSFDPVNKFDADGYRAEMNAGAVGFARTAQTNKNLIPQDILLLFSKKRTLRPDSELKELPDDEVQRKARDRSLPGPERNRYRTEEKRRQLRNKQKRTSDIIAENFDSIFVTVGITTIATTAVLVLVADDFTGVGIGDNEYIEIILNWAKEKIITLPWNNPWKKSFAVF